MIGFNADVAELIQHTLSDAKRKTGNFRGHIVVFRFIQNQFQCRAVTAATSGFNAERTFGKTFSLAMSVEDLMVSVPP